MFLSFHDAISSLMLYLGLGGIHGSAGFIPKIRLYTNGVYVLSSCIHWILLEVVRVKEVETKFTLNYLDFHYILLVSILF